MDSSNVFLKVQEDPVKQGPVGFKITEGKELASGQSSEQFLIFRNMVQNWAPRAQTLKVGYSKIMLFCFNKETASITK